MHDHVVCKLIFLHVFVTLKLACAKKKYKRQWCPLWKLHITNDIVAKLPSIIQYMNNSKSEETVRNSAAYIHVGIV